MKYFVSGFNSKDLVLEYDTFTMKKS